MPRRISTAILCDKTPFYADSGGQVGDAGRFETDQAVVEITDTRKPDGYFLHIGKVTKGPLRPGLARAIVDAPRRLNTLSGVRTSNFRSVHSV